MALGTAQSHTESAFRPSNNLVQTPTFYRIIASLASIVTEILALAAAGPYNAQVQPFEAISGKLLREEI